jgi:hypothetical protein
MANTVQTVENIPEFLTVVEEYTAKWFRNEKTWGPWFRGQGNAGWSLQPTLYRDPQPRRSIRAIEDELRQEFAVRAPSLGSERPRNPWEWYFLMQHCGAPSRLLDWTESALIALFFAVRDKTGSSECDASVWILEPWKLNKLVANIDEVIAPGAESGAVTKQLRKYKPWLPDRYSRPQALSREFPIAVYPTHFSRRISSQRSCFTIHGSDKDGFDHLHAEFHNHLRKVVIPGKKCHEIEKNLSVAGIDEVTIYPDLDGLGRWLKAVLRDESL